MNFLLSWGKRLAGMFVQEDFPNLSFPLNQKMVDFHNFIGANVIGAVNTLGDLYLLNDTYFSDGVIVYLISTKTTYRLDRSSIAADDTLNVLNTMTTFGRWIRQIDNSALVSNIISLGKLNDSALNSGISIYVQSLKDEFILDKSSHALVDGITVIATLSGVGRWVRRINPSPQWSYQNTWYIDPSNILANDENDGYTVSTPLKTIAEFGRRFNKSLRPIVPMTVNIQSSCPNTDPWNITVYANANPVLIQGKPTVLHTGEIDNITAKNPALNIANEIADDVLDWTPYLGKAIRITNSLTTSVIGATAWIAKMNSLGHARVSTWLVPHGNVSSTLADDVQPNLLATYEVLDFPQITITEVNVMGSAEDNSYVLQVLFQNLTIENNFLANYKSDYGFGLGFQQCIINDTPDTFFIVFIINCHLSSGITVESGILWLFGGLQTISYNTVAQGSILYVDFDNLSQGCIGGLAVSGGTLEIGSLCVFDSPGAGIETRPGGLIYVHTIYNNGRVWGNNNATYGVDLKPCSDLVYSVNPIITGILGDFTIDARTLIYNNSEQIDGIYSVPISCTWVNLAAPLPSGFNGNVNDIVSGVSLTYRG